MATPLSCIVVDNDEVDRLTVLSFLEDYPFLTVSGSYRSAPDALAVAAQKKPDVLFLDIDMPDINGLQLRKKLADVPACIFITSYPDYAAEGFELDALDFLVKPFTPERFNKTMERLQNFFVIREKAKLLDHTLGADTVFIKDGTIEVKLLMHEILYLEALNNYTSIVTPDRKYSVLSSLGNLIKEKAFKNFVRIHRSYAVQKHFIKQIRTSEVMVQNFSLPVGRSYKDALKDLR